MPSTSDNEDQDVRLDKWLWAARFYKTRALAAEAIDGGKIDVNGDRAKRSRHVHVGDKLEIRKPPFTHHITILLVAPQRKSGALASLMYAESEQSAAERQRVADRLKAEGPPLFREDGKPSKRDRREIDRWKRGRG